MKAIRFFLVLTILTGLLYPLFITLIGQTFFHDQSNGNLYLIGQNFDQDKYFWSRPSAVGYNPMPSGGSNLSATSKTLRDKIGAYRDTPLLPSDLIYASASGLDPHISPDAAKFQVDRISKARNISKDKIIELIDKVTEKRDFMIFGESRVNVLKLNESLDNMGVK